MLKLDQLKDLLTKSNLPFIVNEKVYFVYNGYNKQKVEFVGDTNCWIRGYDVLKELSDSGIYYLEKYLPLNARIEYKFVVDDEFMLDPRNPIKSSSNFGENSVVKMPKYPIHPELLHHFDFLPAIEQNYDLESKYLKYTKNIKIFLPHTFSNDCPYKVAIFNDGFNYFRYGSIKNIYEYINNKKLTKNFIVVLIISNYDERNIEFDLNDDYSLFILDELIPFLRDNFNISKSKSSFMIGGYFSGAMQAFYTALKSNDLINKLTLQSFTTEYNGKSVAEFISEDKMKLLDIYSSYGKYEKNISKLNLIYLNECFIEMLENYNVKHFKMIYNQGHNWGMWKSDLLNSFIYHFE